MENFKVTIIVLISALFLGGCVATGNQFSAIEVVPSEQSVIYFFQPYIY